MLGIIVGAQHKVAVIQVPRKAAGRNVQPVIVPILHHRQGQLQGRNLQDTDVAVTVQGHRWHFLVNAKQGGCCRHLCFLRRFRLPGLRFRRYGLRHFLGGRDGGRFRSRNQRF